MIRKDLIEEAARIAKRAKAERPSADHVRTAADQIGMLRDRAGVCTDVLLGLGSVLLGAAASYLITTEAFHLWSTASLTAGAVCFVLAISNKVRLA